MSRSDEVHAFQIQVSPGGDTFRCPGSETLLQGMVGLRRKGIPSGCRNGGCGICKIRVLTGHVSKAGTMSRAHVSLQQEEQGFCLACRVKPLSDLTVEVLGGMERALGQGRGWPTWAQDR